MFRTLIYCTTNKRRSSDVYECLKTSNEKIGLKLAEDRVWTTSGDACFGGGDRRSGQSRGLTLPRLANPGPET